jgi:hypothetical protein
MLVGVICSLILPLGAGATEDLPAASLRTWIGPNGKPLPLTTDQEILNFLETAEVVWMKPIPTGVTKPRKVLLEKEGTRMHAIFRDVDVFKRSWRSSKGLRVRFRDSCFFEVAAYKLGLLLGLDNIPPVVVREVKGEKGTMQAWVENAMTEKDRIEKDLIPPHGLRWAREMQVLQLFDNLIYNDDRNQGNILIDQDWRLWMIDATRAFRPYPDLRDPEEVMLCERNMWNRLVLLEDEHIKEAVKDYLDTFELSALLKRRRKLIQHLEELIAQKGEVRVLYEWPQHE